MTPQNSPGGGGPPKRSRIRRVVRFLAIAFSVSALLLGAFVWWSLRVGTEVASLKSMVEAASGKPLETKVAFRLGWPVLTVARWISSAAVDDPVVPEILRGMGRVEVCVSERKPGGPGAPESLPELLKRGDALLEKSGWERAVGVVESDQVVGIYVPTQQGDGESMELLVMVYEGQDLVIVRGRCDLRVVADLVARKLPDHGQFQRLAAR